MKILLVSFHFPPARAVGGLRPSRWARRLPEFGVPVDVVCGPPYGVADEPDPSRHHLVPEASEVHVVPATYVLGRNPFAVPPRAAAVPRAWWKTRAYVEWLFLTRDWAWRWGAEAGRRVEALLEGGDYGAVVVEGPPFPAVIPTVRAARARGVPVVLDARDVWWVDDRPRSPLGVFHPRRRRLLWWAGLRAEAIRTADRVVFTTPDMADLTAEWFPEAASRFSCIPNCFGAVDGEDALPAFVPGRRVRLIHTGSLAYGRLEQAAGLIEAAGAARRAGEPDVEFCFVGGDAEPLAEVARGAGVADLVDVRPWVPSEEAVRLQREAHGLILLQPPHMVETRVAVPAKLFDYMERRRNVLGLVGTGPAARLIDELDLGVSVPTESLEGLMGGLDAIRRRIEARPVLPPPSPEYSEERSVARLAGVLAGLTQRETSPV